MEDLQTAIKKYWADRSISYGKQHMEELQAANKKNWKKYILKQLISANKPTKKILEVGTGPGFIAILLSEEGYDVTAVDRSEEMLLQAKKNAGLHNNNIKWEIMDAEALSISDNTFDAVITRNLTWNLEHPDKFYEECYRVLKNNGLFINIDANWYNYLYDLNKYFEYKKDREDTKRKQIKDYYEKTNIEEMESIAKLLPLSKKLRPVWDFYTLKKIGFTEINYQENINSLVLSEVEQINFRSTPLFYIRAIK
ncbi:class I SAM-dependent methyltransferase [Enterococcus faecium]|uniref:class I SAM-dependent methyltransferase n=1 Tax=Enterococcus TaxID=1350 RepID=UPI00032F23FA|nr:MULTISPECIES: class I SAM-dependent methyltransferase [Enterococcus]EJC3746425.1 class I SAM-dependent methyltransferase [Enterococcus faecium]EME8119991.1 class I SAM-dependent methyltransferase [Enterococcus faecium]EME8125118.1 class I SAM-dependent methyltransferase [Enterococcus faecium]EOH52786.1 hypothetical protein UA3_02476 [Enterococcus faecium EnGen0263]OTO22107.1 hypothetical protein A5816_002779 [Enterococcus sp. 3G1_DIV0629]